METEVIGRTEVGTHTVKAYYFPEGRQIPAERGGVAYGDLTVATGPGTADLRLMAYFVNPRTARSEALFMHDRIVEALREGA